MSNYKFLSEHLKGEKIRLFFVFVFVFLSSIVTLLTSLVISYTIDSIINNKETTNFLLIQLSLNSY